MSTLLQPSYSDGLLPFDSIEDEHGLRILAWRGEPEASLRCQPGIGIFLSRVEQQAGQVIQLSRQWNNLENVTGIFVLWGLGATSFARLDRRV